MKKRPFIIFFVILLLLLNTGCWDRREIKDLAIITAIAVDKAEEEGKIRIAVQIEKPGETGIKGGGGGKSNKPYLVAASTGKDLFEAQRLLATHVSRSLYWAHSKALLIGEKQAREGIGPILDFFDRHQNTRRRMLFAIIEGDAKDALEVTNVLDEPSAQTLNLLFRYAPVHSKGFYISNINDFLIRLSGEGVQPLAARVKVVKKMSKDNKTTGETKPLEVKLTGTAVFKEDKLVGWLDETETLGLLFLLGKAKKAGVNIPCPVHNNQNDEISIATRQLESKITPVLDKDRITINIKIKAEGDILAQACNDIKLTNGEVLTSLNKEYSNAIQKKIWLTINKARGVYKYDFLGFGEKIMNKYPYYWQELKSNWNETFPSIDISLEVEANLKRTGLILDSTTEILK